MNENPQTTFIIGAGNVNIGQFLKIYQEGNPLVAADGGANHLKNIDITPGKIIGDLDSLENRKYWDQKTEVKKIEDQNSTDLEKVLDQTKSPFYLAFGFTGDRFDHTLEVLHVLSKYKNKNIIFFADQDIVFRLPKKWEINLPIGTRLSLYPLHESKILKSTGLKWPVDDLEMKQGHLIGTSNETTEESVVLEQEEENLVGITDAEFYDRIILSIT